MQYLVWRILAGLNHNIEISFMMVGHTKFAPDWAFGLLKQKFKRTPVRCLDDLLKMVCNSAAVNKNPVSWTGRWHHDRPSVWLGQFFPEPVQAPSVWRDQVPPSPGFLGQQPWYCSCEKNSWWSWDKPWCFEQGKQKVDAICTGHACRNPSSWSFQRVTALSVWKNPGILPR